jgi:hypothetical protein
MGESLIWNSVWMVVGRGESDAWACHESYCSRDRMRGNRTLSWLAIVYIPSRSKKAGTYLQSEVNHENGKETRCRHGVVTIHMPVNLGRKCDGRVLRAQRHIP